MGCIEIRTPLRHTVWQVRLIETWDVLKCGTCGGLENMLMV